MVVGWLLCVGRLVPFVFVCYRSLWASRCGSGVVGRSLWVGRCGSVAVVRSLWFGRCGSVAVGWLLWVGRMWVVGVDFCGSVAVLVAVGRLLRVGWVAVGSSLSVTVGQSLCVGRFGSVALWDGRCGTVSVGRSLLVVMGRSL